MSSQRIVAMRICHRAARLLSSSNSDRTIQSDVYEPFKATTPQHRFSYMATQRQLIARCYQIRACHQRQKSDGATAAFSQSP